MILLAHDPRRLTEAPALKIPLVLSGHTHGGQVVLPLVGAVAAKKFPVVAGVARRGETTMFVSRGVGTVYVPVRINCPPEVAVLTLQPRWREPASAERFAHAVRAIRNAFFSPGYTLFGRVRRDYLRLAWRVSRSWGNTRPGSLSCSAIESTTSTRATHCSRPRNLRQCRVCIRLPQLATRRVIDCGANIGMSVLFFKPFKPDAERARLRAGSGDVRGSAAERRPQRSPECAGRAMPRWVDRDGTIAFYSSSTDPGGLTGSIDPSWGGQPRQDVRVVRLSALLRQPVDFLKLDVEGAESPDAWRI